MYVTLLGDGTAFRVLFGDTVVAEADTEAAIRGDFDDLVAHLKAVALTTTYLSHITTVLVYYSTLSHSH